MTNENQFLDSERLMILIMNFQSAAMIGMGKIKNPLTDKLARNLDDAKFAIDMLNMLSNKTKGNLNKDEETLLQKVLTELRLNYIDEVKKDEESKKKEKIQNEKKKEEKEPAEPIEDKEENKKSDEAKEEPEKSNEGKKEPKKSDEAKKD